MSADFVVTWDNGSGHREWATPAQPSRAEALETAGLTESHMGSPDFDYQVEEVEVGVRRCNCGSGRAWTTCPVGSQYCG